jgi:hypothetical protein
VERLGSVGNLGVLLNDLGQRPVAKFPFQVQVPINLISQNIAGNPLNGPVANQFED